MNKHLSNIDLEGGMEGGIFALRGKLDGEIEQDFVERAQFIGLMIAKEEFLLSIEAIDEIVMLPPITYVPHGPRYIDGVINLRGSIVPAVNLRKMMGLEKGSPTPSSRVIIANHNDLRIGLLVDAITYVVALTPSQIESQRLSTKGSGVELISGISKHEGKVMGIFDLQKVIMTAGGANFKMDETPSTEGAEGHA